MAITERAALLSQAHAELQDGVRLNILGELLNLWSAFDPTVFASFDGFASTASLFLTEQYEQSALAAKSYYDQFRIAEGIVGDVIPFDFVKLLPRPKREDIEDQLRANGLVGVLTARRAGRTLQGAKDNAFVKVAGAGTRIGLAGGRDTLVGLMSADPAQPKWYRRTQGNACSFCRMLATKVYAAEKGARFIAHDHCTCYPEPAFEGAAPPASVQEHRRLLEQTKGLRGKERAREFRRIVEGRSSGPWPGTDHLPADLQRALADAEKELDKLRNIEEFRAYGAGGKLLFRKGPGDSGHRSEEDSIGIEFTDAETDELRRMGDAAFAAGEPFVYTHNHPLGYEFDASDPRSAGSAFSIPDWRFAESINASDLRAISPKYIHALQRPPGGWDRAKLAGRLQYWSTTIMGDGIKELNELIRAGTDMAEVEKLQREMEQEHWHRVAEKVAKDLGTTYSRTERTDT